MTYSQPTAATLKARFPAFASVEDTTIDYWLEDARAIVTDAWIEADRAPGEMELAAHNMVRNRIAGIATGDLDGIAAAGVTDFKSASLSVSFDAGAAKAAAAGGYGSTSYGIDFRIRLRRNVGGPSLVGACAAPCP